MRTKPGEGIDLVEAEIDEEFERLTSRKIEADI
jgi:hypothetical protein